MNASAVWSTAQRLTSLQLANEIRSRRAQMKRDLRAGDVDPAELLRHPPDWLATMKTLSLLVAIPRFGDWRARRLLAQARVSPTKTVGGLSVRQRAELADLIDATVRSRTTA